MSLIDHSFEYILKEADEFCRKEEYTRALQLLDELLRREPEFYQGWAKRAYVNDAKGDINAALDDISRAITLCALEPAYFDKRGRYLFRRQKYTEAIADFTRVIELCDYHKSDYYRAPGYFARADAYIRLGDYERAKLDLRNVPAGHSAWTDRMRTREEMLVEIQTRGFRP